MTKTRDTTQDLVTDDVTEDVVTEDVEDAKTEDVTNVRDDTHPDGNPKRSARRVRLPNKEEIMAAVEQTKTDTLEVDPLTKEAAQTPQIVDVE